MTNKNPDQKNPSHKNPFNEVAAKTDFPALEEKVLSLWNKNKSFAKRTQSTLERNYGWSNCTWFVSFFHEQKRTSYF